MFRHRPRLTKIKMRPYGEIRVMVCVRDFRAGFFLDTRNRIYRNVFVPLRVILWINILVNTMKLIF